MGEISVSIGHRQVITFWAFPLRKGFNQPELIMMGSVSPMIHGLIERFMWFFVPTDQQQPEGTPNWLKFMSLCWSYDQKETRKASLSFEQWSDYISRDLSSCTGSHFEFNSGNFVELLIKFVPMSSRWLKKRKWHRRLQCHRIRDNSRLNSAHKLVDLLSFMYTEFLLSIWLIDALSTRSARISNLGWQEKSVEFILVRATTVGDFVEQAVPAHANSCFNLGLSRISLLLKGSFVKLDDHLFVGSRVVLKFSHLWGESVQMGLRQFKRSFSKS